ncbi:hypothetical protein KVR01_009159 [Diaporthe batatas]|uniref:uncharacterized protein n=1 Tax=Diaporthe batatas TaxID=748121 RepID=UPI001D04E9F9|nr:uncharacterized protein KVR01_009159 [Diaporthe batatas]KAG8160895.1 hypothetical protein KVR01_009159 [Diaporthe batatas]
MDGIKPETQPQIEIPDSSPQHHQQQQTDSSPGGYPAQLQTASPSETRPRSRTGSRSPTPRRPQEADQPAVSSSGPGHERMPSVYSIPPKDGQFGVVSSSGQLVCEFRPSSASTEVPQPPPKVPGGGYGNITSASFATTSHSDLRGRSTSPQEASQPGGAAASGTVSTLELAVDHDSYPEAVDRNNYPEVYIPTPDSHGGPQPQQIEAGPPHAAPGKLPPRHSSPSTIPPRKSVPPIMDNNNSTSDFYPSSPPPPMVSSPPAPAYSSPADYQRIGYTGTLDMSTAVATVTPLTMLGDQPDTVDCPFCMRRVETRVKKRASRKTHTWGAVLFFTTLFGVAAPYCCGWYANVEHRCKNCGRKVAQRRFDSDEVEALGTRPEHRLVSAYQPAEKPAKKKKRGPGRGRESL